MFSQSMPHVKVIWILHRYNFRTIWGEFTKNTLGLRIMVFYFHACCFSTRFAVGITAFKSSNATYAPELAL